MKRTTIFTMILVLMLSVFTPTNAVFAEGQSINIYVNGEWVEFDVKPFISVDSRTMSPLRFVSEALGFEVTWYGEKFQVGITGKHADGTDLEVILPIGVNYAYVNGQKMYFDTNTVIVDGRTFVPLRFVSEVFGAEVGYEYGRDMRHNGEFAHIIDVDMDITPSTPVEGQVNVGDIEGGYEAKEMSIDSVTKLGSWVNNDYSKAEMNPNGDYASDLELLDEMLQSGGIDISSTGSIQMQGKDDEFSNDAYAKVKVKTNSKGQVYLEIRGWAYKDYQRNFPEFVLAMNGTREVLKYYSASNADAEAIYAYIDNAIKITPTNDLEKVKTFGNTKIILSDPGVFGYDVIFVN